MTPEMKRLVDAPLANALRLNLPEGKAPAPRAIKPEYHCEELPKLTAKEVRARRTEATNAKVCAILDYYATTEVPPRRIAEHLGLGWDEVRAIKAMKDRGRNC